MAESFRGLSLKEAYVHIVTHFVPGPLNWTYFAPFILLPLAFIAPIPSWVGRWLFLPIIYASMFQAWRAIGTPVDVISFDAVLWSTYILFFPPSAKGSRAYVYPTGRFRDAEIDPLKPALLKQVGQSRWTYTRREARALYDPASLAHIPADDPLEQTEYIAQAYPSDRSALERAQWVGNLLASTRLHNWLVGPLPNPASNGGESLDARSWHRLCPLPPPSRLSFVYGLNFGLALNLLVLPLCRHLAMQDPYFSSPESVSIASAYPIPRSRTAALLYALLPPWFLRPITLGLYAHSLVTFAFNAGVPPLLLMNYFLGLPSDTWSPHTLPPYFGSFVDGVLDRGVAGLWGTWWHQHVRIMSSAPGVYLSDSVLGLRKGGLPRYAVVCVSAFLCSGITHVGLVPAKPYFAKRGTQPNTLRWLILTFFCVQALGILAETLTERALKALQKKWILAGSNSGANTRHFVVLWTARSLRLLWVLGWLCLTLPLLARPFNELHWWHMWPPVFVPKPVQAWLGGWWIP